MGLYWTQIHKTYYIFIRVGLQIQTKNQNLPLLMSVNVYYSTLTSLQVGVLTSRIEIQPGQALLNSKWVMRGLTRGRNLASSKMSARLEIKKIKYELSSV